ncbi:hypothetical protein PV10_02639 [Exophiala mesophila]|uniref:AMP-dependent synthetase/ligase domain-containing protein n=1 Tax=Exophiala mesophila TaxID=212818 RepID=A0A0D1ZLV7_EXOME|nr:uncharacterized protein PV10_02639 [Exophiala mesophila]KIV94919.1 hypothetical protein PV10_02639 [Exophiala mesophila]
MSAAAPTDDNEVVLITQIHPDIVKITLNRPKALNAINFDLLRGLVSALRENAGVKILVLEGAGERSFCAGEDLKQTLAPKTGSGQELRIAFDLLQDITRLTSCSQSIVISAVQGFAIGGGAEIALAADFVIGGPGAKFRFPEVPIGHAATGGITLRLTSIVGLFQAKRLLLRGQFIEADEAARLGLLTELVEDPKARALELAYELAGLPAVSLSSSKTSLERAVFPNMEGSMQDEVNVASYCFAQADAEKAFTDFAARKKVANAVNGLSADKGSHGRQVNGVYSDNIDGVKPPEQVASPRLRDINSALSHAVLVWPDRVFIRFGGKDTTFREMDMLVGRLARGLQTAGIGAGGRVLVMMKNGLEMVTSWLATNRLGATWVPINTELKSITLRNVIESANPSLVIADHEFVAELSTLAVTDSTSLWINGGVNMPNDLLRLYSPDPLVEAIRVLPSTTSAFLFTSGTTGRSKPCILSHEYFILQAQALIQECGLNENDVLYCPFPLFHADATALTTIPALLLGAVAALSVRYSASRFWDEIRAADATVYDFMGATLALTYKQEPSPGDKDHRVRLAWGVPIPSFAPEYERRFGHRLYTLYGSVEASLPIFQQGELAPGSCGRLRKGYQLRIADDADEELPPNTPGHLLLRSDQPTAFFQGYFNDTANTLAAFSNLWLHTGDLAKVDEQGNVYFVGRVKDVIRRRGENINASEVEGEFLQHPDVVIASAYGIPSELGTGTEEDIKVAVKIRQGSRVSEKDLWEWSARHMARFQVPDVIEIVQDIRKTPTGKIEKHGLTSEGGQRFDRRAR